MISALRTLVQLILLACAFLANQASATVMGTLTFGSCPGGTVSILETGLIFNPPGTVAGTGCALTAAGTNITSAFGTIGPGVPFDIKNITFGVTPGNDFFTFPAIPQIDYTLTSLTTPTAPTDGTNCASLLLFETCVPVAGSPFLLQRTATGTNLQILFMGSVSDGVGSATAWSGLLSDSIVNLSPAQVQGGLGSGGVIQSFYSVVVTPAPATVPEPATFGLLSVGLAGLGFARRRARSIH